MEFVFSREKREVFVGGVLVTWETPEREALRGFSAVIEKAAMVYRTLAKARESFETGRASYKNAADRVLELVVELSKAARSIVDGCSSIREWMPTLPPDIFEGFGDEFLAFCREWVDVCRVAPDEAVVPVVSPAVLPGSSAADPGAGRARFETEIPKG